MDGLVALGTIFSLGLAEVKDLPQAAIAKGGFKKTAAAALRQCGATKCCTGDAVRRRAGAHHNALAIHSPLLCFVRPTLFFDRMAATVAIELK